ncbi:ATP-binding protein [Streptomyces sp. NPDC005931]|uniref:ATP-binding protein n=1 Tax=Streptomyces sp. NPDC005931 TaxID=3364737 RepID=UPI00368C3CD8
MNSRITTPTGELAQRLSPTPRGARLARRLTAHQLDAWGFPHGSEPNDTAQHVVGELAANAVTHGRVPGRDFEIRLRLLLPDATLRIEVSDARGDRLPVPGDVGDTYGEGGRGLRLVAALSRAWGVADRDVGKTVWAELTLREGSVRSGDSSPSPCPRTCGPGA